MRLVELPLELKKELLKRYIASADKHGFIFQTSAGAPYDPKNVYKRTFKPTVNRIKAEANKEKDLASVEAFDGLVLYDLCHAFRSWKFAVSMVGDASDQNPDYLPSISGWYQ